METHVDSVNWSRAREASGCIINAHVRPIKILRCTPTFEWIVSESANNYRDGVSLVTTEQYDDGTIKSYVRFEIMTPAGGGIYTEDLLHPWVSWPNSGTVKEAVERVERFIAHEWGTVEFKFENREQVDRDR